ncbi:hypothetical protein ACIOVF_22045 [Pseudomonas sp. NPDC087612]|uniref:hypothetical protein n=1 Tax=Pseudomonas sp. NPDC087612 TaxID=3364441 RepID=UPI0037FBEF17
MPDSKYQRLPHAGDFEQVSGTEIVYLSPKPLPTGVEAYSYQLLHRDANEVYLDFGIGRGNFEFMARCGIAAVMGVITSFVMTALLAGWARRKYEPFWSGVLDFLASPPIWGFIGALALMYVFIFCKTVRELRVQPPIRFNRQRREVAMVPKKGAAPHYVPWEEVIACVSAGKLVTEYAVLPEFKLMIGLRDAASGNVLWLTVACGSLRAAVAEWEAIRAYMEEGPSALPAPPSEEFEEGTVAYFHMARLGYRENFPWLQYVFGFLFVQAFGGWTLPCHISNWVNNRPRALFPKAVQEWSRPLPADQHALPSEALLKESAEVREVFYRGKTLLDYFKVKFAEAA